MHWTVVAGHSPLSLTIALMDPYGLIMHWPKCLPFIHRYQPSLCTHLLANVNRSISKYHQTMRKSSGHTRSLFECDPSSTGISSHLGATMGVQGDVRSKVGQFKDVKNQHLLPASINLYSCGSITSIYQHLYNQHLYNQPTSAIKPTRFCRAVMLIPSHGEEGSLYSNKSSREPSNQPMKFGCLVAL